MTTVATPPEGESAEPSSETESPVAIAPASTTQVRASGVDDVGGTRVAERAESSAAANSAVFEAAPLQQVLKIAGSVVAPTTLLTALMVYFGRLEAAAFFWYLGVQVTVLDLTVQDYLNNSVDGLLTPLIVAAAAALLVLWFHQLVLAALPARARWITLRALMPAAAIAGLSLVCLAIPVFPAFPEGRGLSLALGVLLLTYAARLLRLFIAERRPEQVSRHARPAVAVAEWGAVFILVSVGLFWAVGSYAIGVGLGRAQQFEATLSSRLDVVVYSEKRLSLEAPGVREVTCRYADSAYQFRYDGLKIVPLQSGNQYLLLPAGWTHANGAAILIPRSDKVRLEFSQPGQVRTSTC
ncbi:MAG: hypothetical protein QOJ06_185 [Pseudonocardiales bacterium]|nr:hypothetical protein [Pseudonocardiales bacterium]